MLVYVLDIQGKPLMPTSRVGKVRRMLKNKLAKVVKYEPFTIQLLYETTDFVQDASLGVDSGSRHVGVSATTENKELFKSEIIIRTDISNLIKSRAEFRNQRRYHLRYRKARFNNRTSSKKDGWFPPSIRERIDSHIRIMKFVCDILPVKNIYIETTDFDTQKLKDENIEGEMYQQGDLLGFKNVKSFVRWRDGNICRQCKGKSSDKKIEVHHIKFVSNSGTNHHTNLVCLCHTCHTKLHRNEIKLKKMNLLQDSAKSLRDAAVMNCIKDAILEKAKLEFPFCAVHKTYGYITKFNRLKYNIEKSHCADARVITKNFYAVPLDYMYFGKMIARHSRAIYKARFKKGHKRVSLLKPYKVKGFCKYDYVMFGKQKCFASGRRASGSFELKNLDNSVVHEGISYKKIKYLCHSKNLIFQRQFL